MPNELRKIIQKTIGPFENSSIESKSNHTLKTSAASLKFELDHLIEKLERTVINIIKYI